MRAAKIIGMIQSNEARPALVKDLAVLLAADGQVARALELATDYAGRRNYEDVVTAIALARRVPAISTAPSRRHRASRTASCAPSPSPASRRWRAERPRAAPRQRLRPQTSATLPSLRVRMALAPG